MGGRRRDKARERSQEGGRRETVHNKIRDEDRAGGGRGEGGSREQAGGRSDEGGLRREEQRVGGGGGGGRIMIGMVARHTSPQLSSD